MKKYRGIYNVSPCGLCCLLSTDQWSSFCLLVPRGQAFVSLFRVVCICLLFPCGLLLSPCSAWSAFVSLFRVVCFCLLGLVWLSWSAWSYNSSLYHCPVSMFVQETHYFGYLFELFSAVELHTPPFTNAHAPRATRGPPSHQFSVLFICSPYPPSPPHSGQISIFSILNYFPMVSQHTVHTQTRAGKKLFSWFEFLGIAKFIFSSHFRKNK